MDMKSLTDAIAAQLAQRAADDQKAGGLMNRPPSTWTADETAWFSQHLARLQKDGAI